MTCLLTIDSCTANGSVALIHHGILHQRHLPEPSRQAELLVSEIEALLADASLRYSDLQAAITVTGPGGFTSLRIGLAVTRGIGLAAKIPTYGCSRFTCMADIALRQQKRTPARLFTVLMAGRGEYYWQSFAPDATPLTPPAAATLETIHTHLTPADLVACVDAEAQSAFSTPSILALPDAAALAAWATHHWPRLQKNEDDIATGLRPLYIRPPDAIVPRPFLPGEPT